MITTIPIANLHPHPDNPRKNLGELAELAESIKIHGVLQNLTVVPYEGATGDGFAEGDHYTIIIGHRRMAAAQLAGLTELPCTVSDMDLRTQVATMLLENIQRNDLTVIEQAQGFQMMLDLGETAKSISQKTGFSETTVRKRLFVASLDAKKSISAYERGATLEDYMKLQQLKDDKKRDKVLEALGSHNFDYEMRSALAEELRDRVAPEIVNILEAFAKPTDKHSWELKGYNYHFSCRYEDYEKKGKLDAKLPKKWKPDEYLYNVTINGVEVYKQYENLQAGKKMAELSPAEQEARREERRKYKALKEMAETTYQLRLDFVKSFSKKAPLDAAQFEALSVFAFASICLGDRTSFDVYSSLAELENEKSYYMRFSEKKEAMEKANTPALRVLLISLYATFRDSGDNTYFTGPECQMEKRGYHKDNEKLNAIYDCLCALGYLMSDEEQKLRDGTHELYEVVPADSEYDEEYDEDEESPEESEDADEGGADAE